MVQGYCVKCKAKREMENTKEVQMKNGRRATKGVCSKCGTGMYRIMPKSGGDESCGACPAAGMMGGARKRRSRRSRASRSSKSSRSSRK